MQGFWYRIYKQLGRAAVVAETNKHLCWTEILTAALSLGREKGKLARIIPLGELRFRGT